MELKWTSKGLSDLTRLYDFLAAVNQSAAARIVQQMSAAPTTFLTNPRIAEQLEEFEPRDVRRILVGHYEMRYELRAPPSICCACGIPAKIASGIDSLCSWSSKIR